MAHKKGKGMTGKHHSNKTKKKIGEANKLKNRKLNLSKDFWIIEYLKNKKSMRILSKELGVSPSTIRLELKRNKIKARTPKEFSGFWKGKKNTKSSKTKKRLFKENKIIPWNKLNLPEKEIISMYNDKKLSLPKIAKIFRCSINAIYNVLKRNKILRRSPEYFIKNNPGLSSGFSGRHHKRESIEKYKKWRKKQIYPKRDTKIELKIQNFLSLLHIEYFTHKYISEITHKYQCDIFIPVQKGINQKTIIECDGCYWHGCPICNCNRLKNLEAKRRIDKLRTKELIEKGYKVIRLWGHKINEIELNDFKKILR